MTLINLTEEYLKTEHSSFLDKLRFRFRPDLYWASSLSSMKTELSTEPPRKKERGFPTAYVLVDNVEIRPFEPYEQEEVSLWGMDNGFCVPNFEIKDATDTRVATWAAGYSKKYLEEQRKWRFNTESFVRVPRIFLQYQLRKGDDFLLLGRIGFRKDKQKKIPEEERLLELVPSFA